MWGTDMTQTVTVAEGRAHVFIAVDHCNSECIGKENLLWVRDFETIEELRLALIDFARWYNDNWLVARHRYKTPTQIRENQMTSHDLAA
jgi:hypothetical protein